MYPKLLCFAGLVSAMIAAQALAQDGKPMTPPDGPGAAAAAAAAAAAKKGEDKPDFPPFDEVMKDFKEVASSTGEGCFLSLYRNDKSDELRAVIPAALMNKRFLIASSISGGPIATGFQLDHFLAYFERMDKNLVLMRVDSRYDDAKGKEVADVVNRSYRDEILRSVPIVTMKGGDAVISLDSLFKSDFAGIAQFLESGGINAGLSKWSKYKSFPQNVELTVDAAFMTRQGGGQRMPMHYSISSVPESDYKPRVADPRVGYFMTVRKDWGKKYDERTLFNRYINRWNLQKRDASLDKSPPKKPIVWYIEKTVPVRFRHAVKQGILEWNKAFEKCGFLDAIVVLQQEEGGAYDDLDPEDVRYNFFRWIVTGRGFAMGPSRDHPLTGEIFDADIVFDDSMVRYYIQDYGEYSANPIGFLGGGPIMDSFFKNFPQWQFKSRLQRLLPDVRVKNQREARFYDHLQHLMAERGRPVCDYCSGKADQVGLAAASFAAAGKGELPEEFVFQIVKEIVMHEVGHCLGLRHNFKASTWLELERIVNSDGDGVATVGSVMDYNAETMPIRGQSVNSYITRSIGPYDMWAIEYGYRPVGEPYKSEEDLLKTVAARSSEEGLQYATDEDTFGVLSPDPLSNRFDMGKDPVQFAKRQIELTGELLKDVADWAVKDGQSYTRLRRTFTRLAYERGRVCAFVARFVGGQYMNRSFKGDKDAAPPIKPVEADKQREAVKFLVDNLFAKDVFKFDPSVLNRLAAGRYWHWDSDEFTFQTEFDVHDFVAGLQYSSLFAVMNPFTITRLHDNERKLADGEAGYTLAEHLTTLNNAMWTELDDADGPFSDEKPMIDSFRRNLQRMYVDLMLNYVLEEPGSTVPADCASIARMELRELSGKIADVTKGKLDTASKAHLQDVKKQVDRALDAKYDLGRGGMSGGGLFFFMRQPPNEEDSVTVLPN